ncbi:MAG: class I SAM-dependent methyltransferase, partial [Verrucomicrobiae bacterium]|nr:class I SAM-dependent methyltransferase [Verrucomicrobiae bacterium]
MNATESTSTATLRNGDAAASRFTRLLRQPLLSTLRRFKIGRLQVDFPDGTGEVFGVGDTGPRARISIHRNEFFRKCALHGNVGLGEAYIDGDWDTPDIRAVIEWFILNLHADPRAKGSSQRLGLIGLLKLLDRIGHRLRPNSKTMSRRNIEEHYDLGNDFYGLWLDPTMTYSSALYTSPDQTLGSAQFAKYEALFRK